MKYMSSAAPLAVLAAMLMSGTALAAPSKSIETSVPATPYGITLKVVRIGEGIRPPGSNGNQPRDRLIFADGNNNTLYASAKDEPGKSNCDAECAKQWPPALAAPDAKPFGMWSLVTRDDGSKQWAFRGQPLYASVKDQGPPTQNEMFGMGQGRTSGHDVDGRQVVEVVPEQWTPVPGGMSIQEVRTAPGQVLTTETGLPLYTFAGKADDAGISKEWMAFVAPQIALPVGDFSVISRKDGGQQWAYKGKPLFTYKGDRDLGDSNGQFADKRFQVAEVMRYFMPANVTVTKNHLYGGLLVTTDGKTLYAREQGRDGVDYAARSDRGDPTIGTKIALTGCDTECEKTWQPLLAADDAQPAGYWTLYSRADGKKQWAYFGYALYTYAEDKPGQMTGNMKYDSVADTGQLKAGQQQVSLGLRWRVAPP
jgi:predicted lipoprotein with Yx(FWY)xxD motif